MPEETQLLRFRDVLTGEYIRATVPITPIYDGDDRSHQIIPSGYWRDATRWTVCSIWRARQSRRYVVRINTVTGWTGERDTVSWTVHRSTQELVEYLASQTWIPSWLDEITDRIPDLQAVERSID